MVDDDIHIIYGPSASFWTVTLWKKRLTHEKMNLSLGIFHGDGGHIILKIVGPIFDGRLKENIMKP